jgi:hypothetical protein
MIWVIWAIAGAVGSLWLGFVDHIRDGHPESVLSEIDDLHKYIERNDRDIQYLQSNNKKLLIESKLLKQEIRHHRQETESNGKSEIR